MKYLKSFNEKLSKSESYFDKLTKKVINSWMPVFEYYPKLKAIPIYAWGRYDKSHMESIGKEIDDMGDNGYEYFLNCYSPKYKFDMKALHELYYGKEFGDRIINRELDNYKINRRKIVNELGGDEIGDVTCLILEKNKSGFELKIVKGFL